MREVLLLFSRILDYPTQHLRKDVEQSLQKLEGYDASSVRSMQKFSKNIQHLSLSQLQELYTQHMDFNPSCSLYVGYHLFGDSYKRSKFLVRLREIYRQSGFVEKGAELPDSLPVILHYFGEHTYDSEDSRLIIRDSLLPCLKKLKKVHQKANNIYSDVIQSLLAVLLKIDQESPVGMVQGESFDG